MSNLTRPVLDPWRDAFVLELRTRNVSGAAIGDALAQVDAHCAESGETAVQAFGEPADYAASIATVLPNNDRVRGIRWWEAALLTLGTTLGVDALLSGADGVARGTAGQTRDGALIAAVAGAVVAGLIAANLHWLMAPNRRHRFALAIGAFLLAAFWPPILWSQVALVVTPSSWLLIAGVLVLALTWLPRTALLRRGWRDRIIDPRTGREPVATPRWLPVLSWGFPIALLVAVVLVVVVRA